MTRHRRTTSTDLAVRGRPSAEVVVLRPVRSRSTLPVLTVLVALGFLMVSIVDPYSGAYASEIHAPADARAAQVYAVTGVAGTSSTRDGYQVTKVPTAAELAAAAAAAAAKTAKATGSSSAPAAGTPDPGTAQAIALQMLQERGMGQDQYDCLVSLWNRESHWNVYSYNAGSGAYGIPQAVPGNKMASAGADWQTNPATQITWGLGYVDGRYGSPCGAWAHSQSTGWY